MSVGRLIDRQNMTTFQVKVGEWGLVCVVASRTGLKGFKVR